MKDAIRSMGLAREACAKLRFETTLPDVRAVASAVAGGFLSAAQVDWALMRAASHINAPSSMDVLRRIRGR